MSAERKQLPPTAAEADQELIRQLCAFLDCKHDVEELIATVEELQGIRQRYREAMTEIASLTAMIATYDEEVTKLTKQRDLAEAREDNAKISRRAGLMLLSAIHTAAGDPERKLTPSELVARIRTQHLAQGALSEEAKRLRSTLEIYADPANWANNITYSGSIEPIRIRFVRTGVDKQVIHGFELAQKAIADGFKHKEAP